MIRVLTVKEMQLADKYTIESLGTPEEILIERAGTAVKEEIEKLFLGGRVLFVCGKGNNGQDGIYASKLLKLVHGFSVFTVNADEKAIDRLNNKYDIIVDCIFGTGLKREVDGIYKEIIEKINNSGAKIISVDIPSGLNGDNGKPMGVAVKADYTICIQELKTGLLLNDGIDYCGKIIVKDIGISIWGEDFVTIVEDDDVLELFPKRNKNVNKGNFGKTAIIGGSKNYVGSVMLAESGLSSLYTGVGYSALAVPKSLYSVYAGKIPECIIYSLSDNNGVIKFNQQDFDKLLTYSSLAIGIGMTDSEEVYKTIKYLLLNYTGNLVIDADGLNALSKYGTQILKEKKCKVIITPHVKEFSRLTSKSVTEIISSPIESAKSFAKDYGVTVMLKNATTIITDGQKTFLVTAGTCGMAKGGSGDVLSGVTAGLFARSNNPLLCAYASSYICGKAGEMASKEKGVYSMTATDEINKIPTVISGLCK